MKANQQTGPRLLITGICLAAIVVNKWCPELLKLDPLSAALLVVAVLPWFSGIIKAVKLPFIEIELQEAKEKAERALETAVEAKSTAEGAQTRARVAEKIVGVESGTPIESAATSFTGAQATPQELVDRYNLIRKTHKPSDYRTDLMEQLMAQMISLARTVQNFDLDARLRDPDRGWRLFGYAYLIAHPDFAKFEALAQSAFDYAGEGFDKDQPFGEYWSIRAMQALAAKRGEQSVSNRKKDLLVHHYMKIRRGTDRHFEMKRLLGMLEIEVP